MASPDINTEDFSAAVDFLGLQKEVDRNRIGLLGICGWGGMARAIPPQPQMPSKPIRLRSTSFCRPRKSTAALKSSVLISGEATLRG